MCMSFVQGYSDIWKAERKPTLPWKICRAPWGIRQRRYVLLGPLLKYDNNNNNRLLSLGYLNSLSLMALREANIVSLGETSIKADVGSIFDSDNCWYFRSSYTLHCYDWTGTRWIQWMD